MWKKKISTEEITNKNLLAYIQASKLTGLSIINQAAACSYPQMGLYCYKNIALHNTLATTACRVPVNNTF